MMKRILQVALIVLSIGTVQAQKIVGYLPSYRDPSPTNIQYSKVNTIVYAFINPTSTGNLITTSGLGSAWDFSMTHFLTVKSNCTTYGTKLSISLGGADVGNLRANRLDAVCGNATYRATLVSELVSFAITHNLYGIDIDWEFPTSASARTNHQNLLADLRTAINASANPAIRIGVAVGGEYTGGINHLNYFNAAAVTYVDDFHLMTYDFPVSYNVHHATLTDAQNSFNQWNSVKGVPKSKMYIGVPFYGKNSDRSLDADYRNFSVGLASYDVDVYGGYYYNGKTTLETKAQWVIDNGGQGIMIWDLGQDRTDTYSLLNVLYSKMSTICPAPQPNLGPDVGFCSGNVVLNSGVTTAAGRTFTWKKDGVALVTNSTSATTYTATLGGTYIVEVTQSSCTKSDQIIVTAGSSLSVTGATRCGAGSVTLSVNTAGGPYDWYTASTGGTSIYTGASYTFNETASNTYYVQQNTGSVSYNAGKAVINVPTAWNEAGYETSNSLPRFAHKIVVSQDITLQSVKIWTSNNATSGVKVMVMKSVDGTSIHAQTAPVNLPTGGGPYTLTCNLSLVAGTYYIGVYAPVAGGGANGIWLEPNTNYPSSQAGVYSIEGKSYANYGSGFNAVQTPTHYGQLFDWVISTGALPPCGRTAVTTTINTGANQALTVGSVSPICAGVDGTVTIQNSETNVTYQPYIGASTVGAAASGNGGTLTLTINNPSLVLGANTITIKATKSGCGTSNLTNTASINVNSSTAPSITFGNVTKNFGDASFSLSASSASAGAFTYSFVSSTPASILTVASNGTTTINGAGTATVQVSQAANGCYPSNTATATVTVNKATRTVTITSSSTGTVGGTIGLTNTTSPAGGTATWSKTNGTGTASLSGSTLTLSTAGTVTVQVDIAADANYNAASTTQVVTISTLTTPSITFNGASKTFGDGPFSVSASSNSAGALTYSLVSSTPSGIITVATNGTITILGAGTATVKVDQAANGGFGAGSATATITIAKASRTATITSANSGTTGGTISLTNTVSAGSGSAIWSVTNGTGTASVAGSTLSLLTSGIVTVQVDIAADANYNATSASQVVTISTTQTPQPGNFTTSSPTVTQGQSTVVYTIPNVSGTTYTWSYTGSGGTINGTGNSITIDFGPTATSGTLSVVADNGAGPSIPRTIAITVSAATSVLEAEVAKSFVIYPNPFDQQTTVGFELPAAATINLSICDVTGHPLLTLVNNEILSNGNYQYIVSTIPQGIYLVRLRINEQEKTSKLVKK